MTNDVFGHGKNGHSLLCFPASRPKVYRTGG
jgi:hypothetical protein